VTPSAPRASPAWSSTSPAADRRKGGEDPHFPWGKEQVYPGGNFDYHLRPFEPAFAAGAAQVMPYYGVPGGVELEEVGFGFNNGVVTGLLRERFRFDGVVCTDWSLLTDAEFGGERIPAKCWGVEHLSVDERMLEAIDAGVDQFGGEHCVDVLVELVRPGA
jgi:beta-glucosidase